MSIKFNAKKIGQALRSEVDDAGASVFDLYVACSRKYELAYDDAKRQQVVDAAFPDAATKNRKSEAQKFMLVEEFYEEMQRAYDVWSKGDATAPPKTKFLNRLATRLKKVAEFAAEDEVAGEVYEASKKSSAGGTAKLTQTGVNNFIAKLEELKPKHWREAKKALEAIVFA